jgi:hypothetical protein
MAFTDPAPRTRSQITVCSNHCFMFSANTWDCSGLDTANRMPAMSVGNRTDSPEVTTNPRSIPSFSYRGVPTRTKYCVSIVRQDRGKVYFVDS